MRQNPHVRICGGPGSATTLVYPTIDWKEVETGISVLPAPEGTLIHLRAAERAKLCWSHKSSSSRGRHLSPRPLAGTPAVSARKLSRISLDSGDDASPP